MLSGGKPTQSFVAVYHPLECWELEVDSAIYGPKAGEALPNGMASNLQPGWLSKYLGNL